MSRSEYTANLALQAQPTRAASWTAASTCNRSVVITRSLFARLFA